jgi:hypothetical protein
VFIDVVRGDHVIFLLGILIFKGFTARRIYKSFGIKGLMYHNARSIKHQVHFIISTSHAVDVGLYE